MSFATIAASRIFKGQKEGNAGEGLTSLSKEKLIFNK
jgi:hypothetical protein